MRGHHFRVGRAHGRGGDETVCPGNVRRVVPDVHRCAERRQPLCGCPHRQVGARDGEALVEQHLGNAAHACTADAHEMNVLDRVFHTPVFLGMPARCSHAATKWATASVF